MAENRKRNRSTSKGRYTPKEVQFSDNTPDENELDPDNDDKERSLFWRLFLISFRVLVFVILLAIAALIYRAWTPQNVSTMAGYGQQEQLDQRVQDIPALLRRAQDANYPLLLTEHDINQYLSRVLKGKQHGAMGVLARYEGVGVRLFEGYAEVVIVRTIGGEYHQTVSMYISPSSRETYEGPAVVTDYKGPDILGAIPVGGRIGKLPVPQGYLHFIRPAFISLAEALQPELEILLDPHRPIQIRTGEVQILPTPDRGY